MRGRGRGRGNNRGFQSQSRGSSINSNTGRSSTRTWDRAPATAGSATTPTTSNVGAINNKKGAKLDDRSLQLLPSVSRSSGLEPNGDALRSFETQEEYWKYIVEKILDLELPSRVSSKNTADRQEKEANVMILLRKLREGFVSTKRRDDFAIQVVERSACLALLYNSPTNIASSFSYLLDTYPSSPPTKQSDLTPNKHVISFLHFLHTLLDEYSSQRSSHRLLLPTAPHSTSLHLPPNSPEHTIASSISSALRRHNWYTLHTLTSPQFIHTQLTWSIPKSDQDRNPSEEDEVFEALPQRALFHLLRELRAKVRSSAWPVLRSAYREVVDGPWLERSLMFGREKDSSSGATISELTEFMRLGVEKDEAGVKDSSGARVWILRRPS